MEVDKKEDQKKDDNENGEDKDMQKNKDDFWSYRDSSASEASYARSQTKNHSRSRTELKMSRNSRLPRKMKKRPVQRGRIAKREMKARIKVVKRNLPLKRKPRPAPLKRHQRAHSAVSSASSASASTANEVCSCSRCGHRRRSRALSHRSIRRLVKRILRRMKLYRGPVPITKVSVDIQAGSGANVLSPLLVKTYEDGLQSETIMEMPLYSEVSPDMIVNSLRQLTMWKQDVNEEVILDYMKRHYPVNPNDEELMVELSAKLRIAAELALIVKSAEKVWSLSGAMSKRKLKKNHVALFWKMYSESLALPVRVNPPKNNTTLIDRETNAAGTRNKII